LVGSQLAPPIRTSLSLTVQSDWLVWRRWPRPFSFSI